MNQKYYTGVGSRKTPAEICYVMERIAEHLREKGYILRSGGAAGADRAFEYGAASKKSIFYAEDITTHPSSRPALSLARQVHPAWNKLSWYAKRLHARNAYQVLGMDLDKPSSFLICWTPDGASCAEECSITTGGTATAIKIAEIHGVPVFNLNHMPIIPDDMPEAYKLLYMNEFAEVVGALYREGHWPMQDWM